MVVRHDSHEGDSPLLGKSQQRRSVSSASSYPSVKEIPCHKMISTIWSVAALYFTDEASKCKAWSMSGAVLVMMLGFAALELWFLTMFRQFQNSLHRKEQEQFYSLLKTICVVAIAKMPAVAIRDALKGTLALEWRRYLTNTLLHRYLSGNQAYYRLKSQSCDLDNPDQRIAQDTGAFTQSVLDFVSVMLQAMITILTQSAILFAISPNLFIFVIAYSVVMNWFSFAVFGGRLTTISRKILAQEASLRFGLVRVRENAEPIAFYQGATFERNRCRSFLSELLGSLYTKLTLTVLFSSFQALMGTLMYVLPYAIVAGKYFNNELDFGSLTVAATVLLQLENSFNALVFQMDQVTSMGAQAVRIQQIWETLIDISKVHDGTEHDRTRFFDRGDELCTQSINLVDLPSAATSEQSTLVLSLNDVTLLPPYGQVPLVHNLTLDLKCGDSLLFCGPSGIGKSSLLRAIGGLWSSGMGCIERCPSEQIFFVPQEPYLCLGTLRDNATYPGNFIGSSGHQSVAGPTDAEIRSALREVNAGYLLTRFDLDDPVDLDCVLSGGERQKIGFSRLLLRPPGIRLAIMDEATSALDEASENRIYQLLGAKSPSYISVGHGMNLLRFHSHRLSMERGPQGDCMWQLSKLKGGYQHAHEEQGCTEKIRDAKLENNVLPTASDGDDDGQKWSPL